MPDAKSLATSVDDLAEEFAQRWRSGDRPSVEEYVARYPQWADEIRDILPAVVMMEQLKPRRSDVSPVMLAARPQKPPERLGEYHIIREIGRGGMGVVYEADHEALGRHVAIKVLPANLLANEKLRQRFRQEAQAAARLHHTNIVPVFAVGEEQGHCFYVMQLINGRGLDQITRESAPTRSAPRGVATPTVPFPGPDARPVTPIPTPLPSDALAPPVVHPLLASPNSKGYFRTVAKMGAQVADALDYAHSQGVLHRDIKPSNLLLDDRGVVWVTDFGVAKFVEGVNLTQSGDLVGTLRYMPPEQFAGKSEARGDIYSLGVTLYELLTLRPAFPDTTPQHLIRLITEEVPIRPRQLNPNIPTDLETIVLKAMSREPAHRYQTAAELAEDLQRFLSDRPIVARRIGPLSLLWRTCRRNPTLAVATVAPFLLMIALTVVSVSAYFQTAAANRASDKAKQELIESRAAEQKQLERAELMSALALEGLNRTYARFAPTRLVVVPIVVNADDDPPQPASLPPGAIPVLEELLPRYEQIAREGSAFPSLRAHAAEANHRIGDIYARLGQLQKAKTAYGLSIGLYVQMLGQTDTLVVRIKMARACNELGRTLHALHEFGEAAEMHQRAMNMLLEAPPAFTDRPETRFEIARAYELLDRRHTLLSGNSTHDLTDPHPHGEHTNRRAIELLEKLVAEHAAVPEYRHLLACCYRDLGADRNDLERSVAMLRRLAIDFPAVADYRFDLIESLGRLGSADLAGVDPKLQEREKVKNGERLEEAKGLSRNLVDEFPNVPAYAAVRARAFERHGRWMLKSGNLAEAVRLCREAIEAQDALAARFRDFAGYPLTLGFMEHALGRALSEKGEMREATYWLQKAIDRLEPGWQQDPRLRALPGFLERAYRDLANAHAATGAADKAQQAMEKSAAYRQQREGEKGIPD